MVEVRRLGGTSDVLGHRGAEQSGAYFKVSIQRIASSEAPMRDVSSLFFLQAFLKERARNSLEVPLYWTQKVERLGCQRTCTFSGSASRIAEADACTASAMRPSRSEVRSRC